MATMKVECPECRGDGWVLAPCKQHLPGCDCGTANIGCPHCRGDGEVALLCADCETDPAEIVSADGRARCPVCVAELAAAAVVVLKVVASRTSDEAISRIAKGDLRLAHSKGPLR